MVERPLDELAVTFQSIDHGDTDPVFDRVGGVEELEFCYNSAGKVGGNAS